MILLSGHDPFLTLLGMDQLIILDLFPNSPPLWHSTLVYLLSMRAINLELAEFDMDTSVPLFGLNHDMILTTGSLLMGIPLHIPECKLHSGDRASAISLCQE